MISRTHQWLGVKHDTLNTVGHISCTSLYLEHILDYSMVTLLARWLYYKTEKPGSTTFLWICDTYICGVFSQHKWRLFMVFVYCIWLKNNFSICLQYQFIVCHLSPFRMLCNWRTIEHGARIADKGLCYVNIQPYFGHTHHLILHHVLLHSKYRGNDIMVCGHGQHSSSSSRCHVCHRRWRSWSSKPRSHL